MPTHRLLGSALIATIVVMAAACAEETTHGPGPNLSVAEVNALAPQFDGTTHVVIDGHMIGLNAAFESAEMGGGVDADRIIDEQFTIVRSCPLGGSVTVEGAARREFVRDTRTVTSHVRATNTADACTYAVRNDATIAITGNPNIVVEANRKRVMGVPSGLQTLTHKGSFTWTRSTGETGTCTVDMTATVDPENRTRTVRGTFCNRTIDRTVTWTVPTG
jgi:hypothetical protein